MDLKNNTFSTQVCNETASASVTSMYRLLLWMFLVLAILVIDPYAATVSETFQKLLVIVERGPLSGIVWGILLAPLGLVLREPVIFDLIMTIPLTFIVFGFVLLLRLDAGFIFLMYTITLIMRAFTLYLNFTNLFLFLLRFFRISKINELLTAIPKMA